MSGKEFEDVNAALRQVSRTIAELRGEALAAQVLAVFAMDMLLTSADDRSAAINFLEARFDETLNGLRGAPGSDPALDEVMREAARTRCYALLDELRRAHK